MGHLPSSAPHTLPSQGVPAVAQKIAAAPAVVAEVLPVAEAPAAVVAAAAAGRHPPKTG